MNKQEINNLKEILDDVNYEIEIHNSYIKSLMRKVDNVKKQLEDFDNTHEATDGKLRKWWKPEIDKSYYTASEFGHVEKYTYGNDKADEGAESIGNMFKSEEEAEFEAERRKVYFELKKYVYEHDPRPITKKDWMRNNSIPLFIVHYSRQTGVLRIENWYHSYFSNQVYASNAQTLENAIKAIGEDRIKKYLFGVE